jgi:hypothetical protein
MRPVLFLFSAATLAAMLTVAMPGVAGALSAGQTDSLQGVVRDPGGAPALVASLTMPHLEMDNHRSVQARPGDCSATGA